MEIIKVLGKSTRSQVAELIGRKPLADEEALAVVREIIAEVRHSGDKALTKYTKKFDKVELSPDQFRVGKAEIKEAYGEVKEDFLSALRQAIGNVNYYCQMQEVSPWTTSLEAGASVGERVNPLSRVGIYVPGGRASYPSTVVMNAVPAKVAGVEEIVMCVPPNRKGEVNPAVLVAASELEIDQIFKVGGAQAIAAMAYGTKTVPVVDKITGPGNIYVTLAKKEVYGDVGIDMLAGPSEVVIIADDSAKPEFIASDMRAQAEHDPDALAILITFSGKLAKKVKDLVKEENAKILLVESLDKAVELSNLIAPEHLEVMTENPGGLVEQIKNAGAIFLGSYTPTVVGDYIAGPNHTLPTSGTARFSSPLSVYDFVKRSSLISYTPEALSMAEKAISALAKVEGLKEHAKSVKVRKENAKSKRGS